MQSYNTFSAHQFNDLSNLTFCAKQYSRLKFGCDNTAKTMGYQLAESYFATHTDTLLANNIVVIPSPYNHVKNAATIMTLHFVNKLNELLVEACGKAVEYSIIHRKVSYINDYGFLSKAKRRKLINNDSFYLNKQFLEGKHLLFIDDVKITGTHEDKLIDVLTKEQVPNDAHFLYYAQYTGQSPSIEADINFAAIETLDDFINITQTPNYNVLIRPIKYVLSRSVVEAAELMVRLNNQVIEQMYYGSLAEGYFKIPAYQQNFSFLVAEHKKRQYDNLSAKPI